MVRIRVRIRFSVWLVSCYAHVFVLLKIVIVTLRSTPAHRTEHSVLDRTDSTSLAPTAPVIIAPQRRSAAELATQTGFLQDTVDQMYF